jgi:hypothetical protein
MNETLLAQVRGLVADPTKAPVLHGLLNAETTRIISGMSEESFALGTPLSDEEFVRRLASYELLVEDLARAAALVAYWSRTTDERLVPTVVARLGNAVETNARRSPLLDLQSYPAVLVLHSAGLGAVIGRREEQLVDLLGASTIRRREEWKPISLALSGPSAIDHETAQRLPGLLRHYTPVSEHLVQILRPWLEELEPNQAAFERSFDRWEYLFGLVSFDMSRQTRRGGYGPVGRFSWRREHETAIDAQIEQEIALAGANWPPLRAGLFGGDPARLEESVQGWSAHIAAIRGRQF